MNILHIFFMGDV